MNTSSRLATGAAALLLLLALALPVWRIGLVAPQYPEGLGMQITLHTVRGVRPNDLANINELNHYIGMRVIDPASMPELQYMPKIVLALALAGLVVALVGRRGLLIGWTAAFGAAAVAGMADFWRWTYTYGHNLDVEHAIIKFPDVTYQPPIIGTKQILSFTATSWPDFGGVALALALAAAVGAVWMSRRKTRLAAVAGAERTAAVAPPVKQRGGRSAA